MTILLYCLGAALLVLTGAVVSGGLRLPQRPAKGDSDTPAPADDALSRDLAALMAYGREDSSDEI
ncbi:hypothetical protein [uncultured Agathobaculum sp.]|uniref:hypothetical protein n=1 Tax=uncultured Agathobaculum sp. TaxID=2048140 RepID=UPI00262DA291|nr:hypothetical protein [uncultured Agathobaculum sp.]